MESPLEQAIKIAGSEAKLAEGVGVSQVAINKAKHRNSVSAEMAVAIHRFTKGQVPASALRPDLWRSPEDVPTESPSLHPSKGDEGTTDASPEKVSS